MPLSLLVSLSICSLRNLDIEANKLYDAASLTRCYTQHAILPYIEN